MGGWNLERADEFGAVLQLFWKRFRSQQPDLPLYAETNDEDWKFCIPYCLHGDEGRAAGKRPIMVLSAQPMVTLADMSDANGGGSRRLNSVLRSLLEQLISSTNVLQF